MSRAFRPLIRVSAFIRKEIATILRQPRLIFWLILGPFLILLLFGVGYRNEPRLLKALFVVPPDSQVGAQVEAYAQSFGGQIQNEGVTRDTDQALMRLNSREVDLVIVVPADPAEDVRNNRQAVLTVYHNEIDPFEGAFLQLLANRYTELVNREVLVAAANQGKAQAEVLQGYLATAEEDAALVRTALESGDEASAQEAATRLDEDVSLIAVAVGAGAGLLDTVNTSSGGAPEAAVQGRLDAIRASLAAIRGAEGTSGAPASAGAAAEIEQELASLRQTVSEYQNIQSEILVSPFRSETRSVTEVNLGPTDFYVPAVIALLLQHMAITLAGLSLVQEKDRGVTELFRASPISAGEVLAGKYLSFFLLMALIAAALTALVIFLLKVPMLGAWQDYAVVLASLIFASLGMGFLISLAARSTSQAIQMAMIALLASIFFSGFFLALYRIWAPVQAVSWALPATYGVSLLQNVMLRARTPQALLLVGLLAIGALLFVISWVMLRRQMRLK
jgi:ABC-2 type transport system permease protein